MFRENDQIRIHTGLETAADEEFILVSTPTGNWKVETSGTTNKKHKICSETFTSKIFAMQAINRYMAENATRLFHKERIKNKQAVTTEE